MRRNLFKALAIMLVLAVVTPTVVISTPATVVEAATKKTSKKKKTKARDYSLDHFKDVKVSENYKTLFQGWDYFYKTYQTYSSFGNPDGKQPATKMQRYLREISELTRQGQYGFIGSDVISFEYIQEQITNVDEILAYFALTGYNYAEDGNGYMDNNWMGWDIQHSALINLENNCGVCCETAMVVNYLLEGDYDETGTVYVTGRGGHAYNYIKQDGIYYLIDFTNYTSGGFTSFYEADGKDRYYFWTKEDPNSKICFWSGKSLTSDEATKAVLIHDTYESGNPRERFSAKYNKKNTGCIVAVKYENGNEGCTPSTMTDYSYQQNALEAGGHYTYVRDKNGKWVEKKYMIKEIRNYVPEGTTYYSMYYNQEDTENNYCNCKWVDGGLVPIKQVPYFATVNPKTDLGETIEEKFDRQTSAYAFINDEIKVGDMWRIQNIDYINNLLSNFDNELYEKYSMTNKLLLANDNIYEVTD